MPVWKGGAEKGQAWRDGNWFCIPMTVCHLINNALGQVNLWKVETPDTDAIYLEAFFRSSDMLQSRYHCQDN